MQLLASFPCKIERINHFEITPDRQYLVSATKGKLYIRHLASGQENIVEFERPWDKLRISLFEQGPDFEIAPDGRQMLIHSVIAAAQFDLLERRIVAALQITLPRRIMACFFNSRGCPKLLVDSNHELSMNPFVRHNLLPRENLEIWDLASNKADSKLDISELEKRGRIESGLTSQIAPQARVLATVCQDFVLIRSLEDGRPVQVLSMPADTLGPVRISPDGRYLLYEYFRQHPLRQLVDGQNDKLEIWVAERFSGQRRLALLELRTGKTWLNLSDAGRCTFTDDGTRWTSFGEEGRYEYDVPPRWQYFTPWSWAALGAWSSLIVIWWKLRKRQRGIAAVA